MEEQADIYLIDEYGGVWAENSLAGYEDFYKESIDIKVWYTGKIPREDGPLLFSFDRKTIYNFWTDYPDKLSPEEKQIFDKENPTMANLKKGM